LSSTETEDTRLILNAHPTYPAARSYVLKLHRDADPSRGLLAGRIENVSTGDYYEFTSGAELLACLACDAAAPVTPNEEP
jgi:hypothetical protein